MKIDRDKETDKMSDPERLLAKKAEPTGSRERIASLDFIRGLAVMGILAANIVIFGDLRASYLWPAASLSDEGAPADWMWLAQLVLIDGKMRGLFALLFGAGLVLFQDRADAHTDSTTRQFRRLAILLVFGLMHYFLLWEGDILVLYAVCGGLALLGVGMEARGLLMVGTLIYLLGLAFTAEAFLPAHLAVDFGMASPEMREAYEAGLNRLLDHQLVHAGLIGGDSYGGFVSHHVSEHWAQPFEGLIYTMPEAIGLMLIGIGLYRADIFRGEVSRRIRGVALAGIGIGSGITWAAGLYGLSTGPSYYGGAFVYLVLTPVPKLGVIVGLVVLLAHYTPRSEGWLGDRIKAAGRAAFSNYIGTSLLMIFVFHGWGLGLFGKLSRPELYLVMLGAWIVMLLWSKPWLERYRYGPLEWLWRCLTYGKLFAMRRN